MINRGRAKAAPDSWTFSQRLVEAVGIFRNKKIALIRNEGGE
jgi:hypothetical protein